MPDTDEEIFADADRLVQVMINLLANAVRFAPEGSQITVGIETTPAVDGDTLTPSSNGWTEFTVADQGPGIPAEDRERIFDRFQQAGSDDGRPRQGSGLGLYICKKIVELHGGVIGVDSPEPGGSLFWFKIPVQRQSDAPQNPEHP